MVNGGQQLIDEWLGLDEFDNPIRMDEVARGGRNKVKWKCMQGHVWTASIKSRSIVKSGCNVCGRKTASDTLKQTLLVVGGNDLKTWCQNNGEFGRQIISEWLGLDENGNAIRMDEVAIGTNKKMQWRCAEGHVWTAIPYYRCERKAGCKICGYKNLKLSVGENNLLTWCKNNGDFGQQIISE